jgi:PAS domain S-box-containing protein
MKASSRKKPELIKQLSVLKQRIPRNWKQRNTILFLAVMVGICIFLFTDFYSQAKQEATKNINREQLLHASQAARGIEDFFDRWARTLTALAESGAVINMDRAGKEDIALLFRVNQDMIRTITRVDAAGRIVYTFPFNRDVIGRNISTQPHIRELMRTHKPVISDVFPALQGYDTVALHVPVFRKKTYHGTIGITINFQALAKRYLEDIKIGNTGYAWMISRDGTELYCPVPGHTGKSVFENCKDFPSILIMARDMLKGKQGLTTYVFDNIRGDKVESVKKNAAYMPIHLGNTFWSIVVASSEDEIISSLMSFRIKLIAVISFLLFIGILFSYYGLKALFIIGEEEKRRRIEEALQASEEHYRKEQKFNQLLLDSSPAFIVAIGFDGKTIMMNQSLLDALGYTKEEIKGADYLTTFVPEEDRAMLNVVFQEIIQDGKVTVNKNRILSRSGKKYLVEWHGRQSIHNGGLGFFVGIGIDITARKQAEEELVESEQRLTDIVNFLPDATFAIDQEGKVILWNHSMEQMTGVSKAEMIGKRNYEYAIPFYGQRRPLLIDLALLPDDDFERNHYEGVYRQDDIIHADAYVPQIYCGKGASLWGIASKLRDTSGNIIGAIESIRDTTERKRVEVELQDREAMLRTVFNAVPSAITVLNAERTIENVSDATFGVFGYPRGEMIGRNSRFLYFTDEEYKQVATALYGGLLMAKPAAVEVRMRRKDGAEIWALLSASPINAKDISVGSVVVGTDITARKSLEAQLRQSQKMESIGTLAGGIAHDFNNILGSISGFTEIAMGQVPADSKINKYLKQIFKSSRRAVDLVNQILTFSRGTTNKLQPLRLGPLIKEVLKLISATTPTTIDIRQNITAEPDIVMADATYIHQVVMNLCTNANFAMQKKGGVLSIGLVNETIAPGDVQHSGVNPGSYLKLTVSDTGEGIEAAHIEKIFDPFFTTKKQGEGTGLGLSVIHGIVKSLGGKITVDSRLGQGTSFEILLPLLENFLTENIPEKEGAESIRGSGKILFVDDEEDLVEMATEMLECLGYEVTATQSSVDALEMFRANPDRFDLIITDQTMPKISGMAMAQEMMRIRPDIPIILCTGFSSSVNEQEVKTAGIRKFVLKPIIKNEIAISIHQILKNGRAKGFPKDS